MESRIIAGRYELVTEWDRGGMSIVYLARDRRLKKNWAVKEILKEGAPGGKAVSNDLLAEAALMKNLTHPALPRIIDIVSQNDTFYIIMDFVEGDNLKNIMLREGAQSQDKVIRWGTELAAALDYLHRQSPPIIYRDMKPSNIMLQPDGQIKLIDFGIARIYKEGAADDTTHLGTYGYAAPEQFAREGGPSRTDARTDVYDLGATLYSLVTGITPENDPYFKPGPIRRVDPSLSAGLEKILIKCTQPNPADRYQSMQELMNALLNYEKLDEKYVRAQKRKLRKAFIPAALGFFMLIASGALFASDAVIKSNTYEGLLLDSGNTEKDVESLQKAISMRPGRPDAYERLCEKLATDKDGLTEDDAQIIKEAYANITKVRASSREYLEINYMLGEEFLVYFTGKSDDSVRNRLINAEPFFRAVAESGKESFEGYELCRAYVFLTEFYKTYILGGGSAFSKEAGKEQYEEFLESCSMVTSAAEKAGNDQLKLASCTIVLDMIDLKKADLAGHVPLTDADAAVAGARKVLAGIDASDERLAERLAELKERAAQVQEALRESYGNTEKGRETK